ncbi:MAG: flagellar basal body rod protein FlgG [Bacillota bacterium]|nr:flagellar basal body rod protein FlgG [Bacillota bacterium]
MLRGLYTAVSGMITQEKKQEVITNNMANVSTTGFKEDTLNVKSFDEVLIQNYDKQVKGMNVKNQIGSLSLGSQIDGTSTNFTQGTYISTDEPLDFAVSGAGFFKAENDGGKEFYTRDGHFSINNQGYLVDENGNYVMGKNIKTNLESRIKLDSSDVTSDGSGNLSENGKTNYKLNIYTFADNNSLTKVGDNLYTGNGASLNQNGEIKQKTLEGSNVNIINSMVNMMTTMRAYEANQKVISAIDETLGKAVNEVGSVR